MEPQREIRIGTSNEQILKLIKLPLNELQDIAAQLEYQLLVIQGVISIKENTEDQNSQPGS